MPQNEHNLRLAGSGTVCAMQSSSKHLAALLKDYTSHLKSIPRQSKRRQCTVSAFIVTPVHFSVFLSLLQLYPLLVRQEIGD